MTVARGEADDNTCARELNQSLEDAKRLGHELH